ncbi:MAG: TonB family protein [Sphingopyxis sp.]|uniref:energy transducer TonB n=1 Tax=Sphingopyxis sp. TaxID=1908224 RepID=UPI002AB831FD|nr:TonB family protein [Sphingopyxis sp.]MDZ3832095.1 TonB family protein [Sphingopyxis sp.]
MTLIPLISAIVATPEHITAPAGGPRPLVRGSYDPGAGHRPIAALFAFGLPAALVVAVALSPMVIDTPPRSEPASWTSIPLANPDPAPLPPEAKPRSPSAQTPVVAPPTPLPPITDTGVTIEPIAIDGPTVDTGMGTGTDRGGVFDPPPPPPPLVLAKVDPRFARLFQPDYPAREQRAEMEGSVTVRVLIGTDGRVKAVEQLRSDSPGFFEATRRQALSKWRFKPATRGGVAEESWKEMTVRFEIRNA